MFKAGAPFLQGKLTKLRELLSLGDLGFIEACLLYTSDAADE